MHTGIYNSLHLMFTSNVTTFYQCTFVCLHCHAFYLSLLHHLILSTISEYILSFWLPCFLHIFNISLYVNTFAINNLFHFVPVPFHYTFSQYFRLVVPFVSMLPTFPIISHTHCHYDFVVFLTCNTFLVMSKPVFNYISSKKFFEAQYLLSSPIVFTSIQIFNYIFDEPFPFDIIFAHSLNVF